MGALFMRILEVSCYATVAGAALLLIRRILRGRITASWQYALWLVLLLRLILPFEVPSAISLFNVIRPAEPIHQAQAFYAAREAPPLPAQALSEHKPSVAAGTAQAQRPAAPVQADAAGNPPSWISILWLAGAAVVLLWHIAVNLIFRARLRRSAAPAFGRVRIALDACRERLGIRREVGVVVQDATAMPALYGVLRPRILLTPAVAEAPEETLTCVLMHELAHLKRRDALVNALLVPLRALHWFNPAMGFLFAQMRRDMEAATDEMAIRALSEGAARTYAHSLLDVLAESGKAPLTPGVLGVVDDKKGVERRIRDMKRVEGVGQWRRRIMAVIGAVAIALCAVLLLTNAVAGNAQGKTDAFEYAPLSAIAEHRTPYVGDASAVGNIVSLLPSIGMGHAQRFFSLQTDAPPYGLTLYYEPVESAYRGSLSSVRMTGSRLNAMILFAFIDNLDTVTYAYRDTPTVDGELDRTAYAVNADQVYNRADFEATYGSLRALADDLPGFQSLLLANWRIEGERAHFNRIHVGTQSGVVETRNSEPSERVRYGDGRERWIYRDYGASRAEYADGTTEDFPGGEVWMEFAPQSDGALAVTQMRMIGDGGSEILYTLDIQTPTYDEVLFRLSEIPGAEGRASLAEGFALPDTQAQARLRGIGAGEGLAAEPPNAAGARPEWLFVPLREAQVNGYLFFHFREGILAEHGVTANDAALLRGLWTAEESATATPADAGMGAPRNVAAGTQTNAGAKPSPGANPQATNAQIAGTVGGLNLTLPDPDANGMRAYSWNDQAIDDWLGDGAEAQPLRELMLPLLDGPQKDAYYSILLGRPKAVDGGWLLPAGKRMDGEWMPDLYYIEEASGRYAVRKAGWTIPWDLTQSRVVTGSGDIATYFGSMPIVPAGEGPERDFPLRVEMTFEDGSSAEDVLPPGYGYGLITGPTDSPVMNMRLRNADTGAECAYNTNGSEPDAWVSMTPVQRRATLRRCIGIVPMSDAASTGTWKDRPTLYIHDGSDIDLQYGTWVFAADLRDADCAFVMDAPCTPERVYERQEAVHRVQNSKEVSLSIDPGRWGEPTDVQMTMYTPGGVDPSAFYEAMENGRTPIKTMPKAVWMAHVKATFGDRGTFEWVAYFENP